MTNKKHDLPALPFYVGDWLKCPEVRALSLDARAVWFDMLCYMWESTERGYLTINGKPIPDKNLAQMLGVDEILLKQILKQLLDFAIYSVRESDGAIYSRKMVRDEEIRKIRQKVGSEGGKKSFASRFAQAKSQANTENENEIENEKNNIEDRIKKFKEDVFTHPYPPKMLDEFFAYWSEPNLSKTKFKKELEKTWDTGRRLKTWMKNQKQWYGEEPQTQPRTSDYIKQTVENLKRAKNGNS